MAYLADENVPLPMLHRLRVAGYTIQSISESAPGTDDVTVLERADHGGLIVITCDHDFGELTIGRGMPVAGVVLLELARLPLSRQIDRVVECFASQAQEFPGRLTIIEPTRTRSRTLLPPNEGS